MKNGSLLCCIFNLQGQSWNLRAPRVVLSEIGRNQISWQSEPLQARDIASSPEFHQRHSDYPTSYEWRIELKIFVHLWENLWLNRSCRYRSQKSKLIRNCGTKFFLRRIPLAKSADKSLAPSWGGAGDYRDNHDHFHFDHYHFDHYRFDHLTVSIDIIFMISLKVLTKLANL